MRNQLIVKSSCRQPRPAILLKALAAILLLAAPPMTAADAEFDPLSGRDLPPGARWSASGGQTSLRFDPGLMAAFRLRATGSEAQRTQDQPGDHVLAISPASRLDLWAPGGAYDGFAGGRLEHRGNLVLHYPGGSVNLRNFTLSPVSAETLQLRSASGEALFELDYIHVMLYPERGLLTLANMDVRISAALADRLGEPATAGMVIGQAFTSASLEVPEGEVPLGAACTSPNWHDGVNFITDVELYNIGSVQMVARQAGVRVAIAPSASLRNVGTADVPWYPKFHTGVGETYPEPYDRDQHPFLVWALYRDAGGLFEQVAASELKHAFFTINTACGCPGGNILWSAGSAEFGVGCTDIYGVSTNDDPLRLGIREELPAFTGAWEQCGSMFAPGATPPGPCAATFSGATADEFERRLVVAEAELAVGGASYWMEAWYLIRDDANIFNSMARVPLSPSLVGSTWTFSPGATAQAPAIDAWVAPGTSTANSAHVRGATGSGRYSLAVKVIDLGGGNRRYIYALMNFDFDAQFDALTLPLPDGVTVSNTGFADADADPANDWVVSTNGGQLAWNAPPGTALDWGSMATFYFESQAAPVQGIVTLSAEDSAPDVAVLILTLDASDLILRDGFEDP
jgi:hypothetical protein